MKKLRVVIIGAGARGVAYAENLKEMEERYEVVGVADPIEKRRNTIQKMFELEKEQCFEKWEDLLCGEKIADVAIIATQDNGHYNPAMKAIELGYNLLLEKPVAQTAKECIDIANAARDKGVKVLVCHVLRYTPFYKTVKKIIDATGYDRETANRIAGQGPKKVQEVLERERFLKSIKRR